MLSTSITTVETNVGDQWPSREYWTDFTTSVSRNLSMHFPISISDSMWRNELKTIRSVLLIYFEEPFFGPLQLKGNIPMLNFLLIATVSLYKELCSMQLCILAARRRYFDQVFSCSFFCTYRSMGPYTYCIKTPIAKKSSLRCLLK